MVTSIVWLKRDLRFYDHAALTRACRESDQVIALYIYEPDWFKSYEFDSSHLEFLNQSLKELLPLFDEHRICFITRKGDALEVLKALHSEVQFNRVYSHEETGVDWTYKRDRAVKSWLKTKGVPWLEFSQFAVTRGLKSRELWNESRVRLIERPLHEPPRIMNSKLMNIASSGILRPEELSLPRNLKLTPRAGPSQARQTLESFLGFRSRSYLAHISDPHFSQESSSRLSPYITFGNISLSQIHHRLSLEKKKAREPWGLRNLEAFESRLWWHCHFIQKLETEPDLEFENVNRAFDGLRENDFNPSHFEAWSKGETGYPLIDACMRSLLKTGWLNFRMRAMLVSFASYQLWLDWRVTSHYLAKHFLDFEPGIHFSQFQMQSGVTGINSIRIYSPLKQSEDQKGALPFVRHWVPELEKVPDEFALFPSEMPAMLQIMSDFNLGRDYPHPIVDPVLSYERAKRKIFEWRELPEVKTISQEVLKRHASRSQGSRGHFPRRK